MTEDQEIHWNNPDNWSGPDIMAIYFCKADPRCFVPKKVRAHGWTLNFGHHHAGKWLLIWSMLLGRLEVYTVIILLVPEFWRK